MKIFRDLARIYDEKEIRALKSENAALKREIENLRGTLGPGNAGGCQAARGGGQELERVCELAPPFTSNGEHQ